MKHLFVLNHASYLRHYGEVIRELARRGGEVVVTFTHERPGDRELFARAFAGEGHVGLTRTPERSGWWWAAADPLRAVRDYVHYLGPAFDDAPRLVDRASARVPGLARRLAGSRHGSGRRRAAVERLLDVTERAVPADPALLHWLERERPDTVLVSPLLEFGYDQLHMLKAARALGIPTGHLVASWDNLTNKSRIQILADRVIVWNDVQQSEAGELHGVPPDRVVVTGAQLYDPWFAPGPATERDAYCDALGLDPSLPIVLYAASSAFVAPDEVPFAREWIGRLRGSGDPTIRSAQVLIRPHPQNAEMWRGVIFAGLEPVVIREPPAPAMVADTDRRTYGDDLRHAAAVMGINTSVFLEAAIFGRPCLSLRTPEFEGSQLGTLHFRHLVEDGIVDLAPDYDTHLRRLGDAIRGGRADPEKTARFVERFLRPHGVSTPTVPIVADALTALARTRPEPVRRPFLAPLVLAVLAPFAALYLRPRYLARRAARPPRPRAATRDGKA